MQQNTNESDLKLSMVQAESPGKPTVDIRYDDASLIEFWLEGPTVKGPDVSHYTVSYKVKGSNDEPTVMTVAKEYRDHIDTSRKYTVLRVEGLKPSTIYVFNFFAKNDVGTGPARELEKTTKQVRVPDTPKLDDTPMNSGKPTSILVKWSIPSNGGAQILEYRLTYQRVNVKTNNTSDNTAYKVDTKIGKPSSRTGIKDPSVLLDNLLPGSFYEIKVSAVNQKGEGLPATKVVRTQIGEYKQYCSIGFYKGLIDIDYALRSILLQ
ncbi:fasciclin-2-like [Ruditapes philippinarum]|uniref:fasciclin-2-like n=1 Tax=Ruditapes philippinarum TaxID=129788 RepID=UPI00295B6BAD|nr:fasciclin-2-like [Ruditapes philippinarum]